MEQENEIEEKSISQRINDLGVEIMTEAFRLIDKAKNRKKIYDTERDALAEMQKQFVVLEKTYASILKMNKTVSGGKSSDKFESDVLKRIKESKSSLGNIVTKIPSGETK